MTFDSVVINLKSFTDLLEKLHLCHKGNNPKLQEISKCSQTKMINFECCDTKFDVGKLQIIASCVDAHLSTGVVKNHECQLHYEEVIYIDENMESKIANKNSSIESVFVNMDDQQISQPQPSLLNNETDPLSFEQKMLSDDCVIKSDPLTSKYLKLSAKNIFPKVVNWSSESIENISNEDTGNKKRKYPSTLICEFCGLEFKNKDRVYKLFYHKNRVHTKKTEYKCPDCERIYWGERELSFHMISHMNPGHVCDACGIKFQRKNDLVRHFLTHKNKQYNCEYCYKMFRRKDHLKTHERLHTGNFPHVCHKCGSGYPQKHQLKLHAKKCPSLRLEKFAK